MYKVKLLEGKVMGAGSTSEMYMVNAEVALWPSRDKGKAVYVKAKAKVNVLANASVQCYDAIFVEHRR